MTFLFLVQIVIARTGIVPSGRATTNPLQASLEDNITGLSENEVDQNEGPGPDGNGFVAPIPVTAGEQYYILVDRPMGHGGFDLFVPKKNPCGQSGKLRILDRYGRVIYSTDDLYTGWDGTEKSRKLPETDYWYLFQSSDSGKTYTGHFSVLR
ncbi:gliding motility-associated C-terminal domain-containing protein [Zobellia uliginosa]|uniref:Gliding motility-associated C-terminal domain-containing protein n=1 Tax=Zobellia uliginosa TaxID=143224 RepID=A0ABY1L1V0_9FLAO|nr:T9SS type B sorting domain-containing protein [Zobellia uliginosa]SIS88871.1 gliding motility-associated C-terminal domain-containing protein [Zobellia uliginosa]